MRTRQWALPALGAVLFTFSMVHVVRAQKTRAHPEPAFAPAPPAGDRVAGVGIVEPSSENVAAGSHRSGVVARVHVRAGASIANGDPLFCLDERAALADLEARRSDLALARALLDRIVRSPRAEELPPLVARVAAARAHLVDAEDNLARTKRVVAANAVAEEQGVRALAARDIAASDLRAAESDLDLKRAGAWAPDRAVAQAAVAQAAANVDRAKTELDLLCVRSPIDGAVLRVDVRVGEYVSAGQSALTLGVTTPLHVRVDVDEVDIPRVRVGAPAVAYVRGGGAAAIPLAFVRVEPAVLPKRSLSGASTERLDTRVLQVVYRVDASTSLPFVGQQVDVFVDVASSK